MLNNVFCSNEVFTCMFSIDYIYSFMSLKLMCSEENTIELEELSTLKILASGINLKNRGQLNQKIKHVKRQKYPKKNKHKKIE
jgi:hypothetical protein